MRLPLLVAVALALGLAIPVWRWFPHGEFFAGMWVGGVWGLIVWVWSEPPEYIAKWKRGAAGERMTGKALRRLEREGWRCFHDRDGEYGNLDHVVIGAAGVFLLDSKNLAGEISVEPGGMTTRHEGAPRDDFTHTTLEASMRGAAARLKSRIERTTQLRPWVQAVVVIWGDFPAGVAEGDRVTYVAGDRLADWIGSHQPRLTPRNQRLLELALDAELVAPPAPAIS